MKKNFFENRASVHAFLFFWYLYILPKTASDTHKNRACPSKLTTWLRANQDARSLQANRPQREAWERDQCARAQLLFWNSKIGQVVLSIGREELVVKEMKRAWFCYLPLHMETCNEHPIMTSQGNLSLFENWGMVGTQEDIIFSTFTSFLELRCDVEFTLHFSFQHKDNLLLNCDGAIRIQLWKWTKYKQKSIPMTSFLNHDIIFHYLPSNTVENSSFDIQLSEIVFYLNRTFY